MRRLSKFKFVAFSIAMIAFFINCPLETANANNNDPWTWAEEYAPYLTFHKSTVKNFPQRFPSDDPGSGVCTYLKIKEPDSLENGYRFQYWFYYAKDIRIDEKTDKQIRDYIISCKNSKVFRRATSIFALNKVADKLIDMNLEKAFHKHDWECVEVYVTKLGDEPKSIRYCAHGKIYPMKPDRTNLFGFHPQVRVISDMHGCYPPGPWMPIPSWSDNWGACIEFILVWAMDGFAPEMEEYKTQIFWKSAGGILKPGDIRKFTKKMENYNKWDFKDYPYEMPWQREFYY
jgi:hypothetical protein